MASLPTALLFSAVKVPQMHHPPAFRLLFDLDLAERLALLENFDQSQTFHHHEVEKIGPSSEIDWKYRRSPENWI
tara:strand:+ start:492 stop:716 length:225 start_codon:yes stop_codon:yes gene_type:complete